MVQKKREKWFSEGYLPIDFTFYSSEERRILYRYAKAGFEIGRFEHDFGRAYVRTILSLPFWEGIVYMMNTRYWEAEQFPKIGKSLSIRAKLMEKRYSGKGRDFWGADERLWKMWKPEEDRTPDGICSEKIGRRLSKFVCLSDRILETFEKGTVSGDLAWHRNVNFLSVSKEIGKKIAPMMVNASLFLLERASKKKTNLVVYGRDGEIIYDTLLVIRKLFKFKVPIRYFVMTRNQLSDLRGKLSDETDKDWYMETVISEAKNFLGNLDFIGPSTIHVDTGFRGTIPRDLVKLLSEHISYEFDAPDIQLLSAEYPEYQIPLPKKDREMVLDLIEHAGQRMTKPRKIGNNGKRSSEAILYYARKSGVMEWISENIK